MRRAVRALGALLACALALGGCTRSAPETGADGRSPWTIPHVLRLVDVADPDSLNPLLSTMDLSYDLSALLFSYLVVDDGRGRLTGDLALQVPTLANGGISRDGRTYVYHLHRGVRWHDGVPLTSRDVAFTWRTIMNPHNNVLHREGYDEVASIGTPDPYTVIVHLKRRYPPFVTQFFTTLDEGAKPIVPEHVLGGASEINDVPFNAAPVGSGPFRFVRWDRGERIVLARNDAYFKGRPQLERIELTVVPDLNSEMTVLRTHAADMPVAATALVYDRMRDAAGFRRTLTPWNSHTLLMLQDARPALRDVHVRRAIAHAIDYSVLIDKVAYGTGVPSHDIVPPSAPGYTAFPPYAYDPAAANAELDAAGWRRGRDGIRARNGVRLQLLTVIPSNGIGPEVAVQLQQMLAAAGIGMTIKMYPYHGVFAYDGPIVTGRFDMAIYAVTVAADPDTTTVLTCAQIAPRGDNQEHFCDPRIDALERAGLRTDDPAKRAAIYREIDARVRDAVPFIVLWDQRRPMVLSTDVRGYDPAPGAGPWWNAWTWSI
ncbi:MAG TPA: peptide ABC transporter substrate-binding protein [Candidatus Baltobacteraceae bacterium]|nr:peptide ABC transporter substrate-binding protein [Candidatus Baltobacteraceae bacterium]